MANLREISNAVGLFSEDHDGRYPPSIATVGQDGGSDTWQWYDPRRLVAVRARSKGMARAVSTYLADYVPDPDLLHCNMAPDKDPQFKKIWTDGESALPLSAYHGSYSLLWNYEGLVDRDGDGKADRYFKGPQSPASGGRFSSKLLACDYFSLGSVVDKYPPPKWASSEIFPRAECMQYDKGTTQTDYHWITSATTPDGNGQPLRSTTYTYLLPFKPSFTLKAAYTDGHVERTSSLETSTLKVIKIRSSLETYEPGEGTGWVFIPNAASQ